MQKYILSPEYVIQIKLDTERANKRTTLAMSMYFDFKLDGSNQTRTAASMKPYSICMQMNEPIKNTIDWYP